MKKYFILSMLISFAMLCSCQKEDSTAVQQPQKAELDARENALNERLNALDERVSVLDGKVKALAEKEQANLNTRMTPTAVQGQTLDPAQVQAERDRKIQEIAAEFRATVPDSGKDTITKERLSQAQDALKALMGQKQPKWQTSGSAGSPAVQAASPTSSPTPQ